MRGHFLSQTRKLNHRYQSGRRSVDDWAHGSFDWYSYDRGNSGLPIQNTAGGDFNIIKNGYLYFTQTRADGWYPYWAVTNSLLVTSGKRIDTRTWQTYSNEKIKFTQERGTLVLNNVRYNIPFDVLVCWVDCSELSPQAYGTRYRFNIPYTYFTTGKIPNTAFDMKMGLNSISYIADCIVGNYTDFNPGTFSMTADGIFIEMEPNYNVPQFVNDSSHRIHAHVQLDADGLNVETTFAPDANCFIFGADYRRSTLIYRPYDMGIGSEIAPPHVIQSDSTVRVGRNYGIYTPFNDVGTFTNRLFELSDGEQITFGLCEIPMGYSGTDITTPFREVWDTDD